MVFKILFALAVLAALWIPFFRSPNSGHWYGTDILALLKRGSVPLDVLGHTFPMKPDELRYTLRILEFFGCIKRSPNPNSDSGNPIISIGDAGKDRVENEKIFSTY